LLSAEKNGHLQERDYGSRVDDPPTSKIREDFSVCVRGGFETKLAIKKVKKKRQNVKLSEIGDRFLLRLASFVGKVLCLLLRKC
jgi:hypothetical protein